MDLSRVSRGRWGIAAGVSSGAHARRERPSARRLLPLSSYPHTLESDGVARRERQIVQSWLNLVEFSP